MVFICSIYNAEFFPSTNKRYLSMQDILNNFLFVLLNYSKAFTKIDIVISVAFVGDL